MVRASIPLLLALGLGSCTGRLTVEQVRDRFCSDSPGQSCSPPLLPIEVEGTAVFVPGACTERACPAGARCCNACSGGVALGTRTGFRIDLRMDGVECRGNSCELRCGGGFVEGARYLAHGRMVGRGPQLAVVELEPLEAGIPKPSFRPVPAGERFGAEERLRIAPWVTVAVATLFAVILGLIARGRRLSALRTVALAIPTAVFISVFAGAAFIGSALGLRSVLRGPAEGIVPAVLAVAVVIVLSSWSGGWWARRRLGARPGAGTFALAAMAGLGALGTLLLIFVGLETPWPRRVEQQPTYWVLALLSAVAACFAVQSVTLGGPSRGGAQPVSRAPKPLRFRDRVLPVALAGAVISLLLSVLVVRYVDCGFIAITRNCGGYFAGLPFPFLEVEPGFPRAGIRGLHLWWLLASAALWTMLFVAWTAAHAWVAALRRWPTAAVGCWLVLLSTPAWAVGISPAFTLHLRVALEAFGGMVPGPSARPSVFAVCVWIALAWTAAAPFVWNERPMPRRRLGAFALVPILALVTAAAAREIRIVRAERAAPIAQHLPFEIIGRDHSSEKNPGGGCMPGESRTPALRDPSPSCIRLVLRFTRLAQGQPTAVSYYLLSRGELSGQNIVGGANVITYLRGGAQGIDRYLPADPSFSVPGGEVTLGFDVQRGREHEARFLLVLFQTAASYASDEGGPAEQYLVDWQKVPLGSAQASLPAVPKVVRPREHSLPPPPLPNLACEADSECVLAWRYYREPYEEPCRCGPQECPLVVHRNLVKPELCLVLAGESAPEGCVQSWPMSCKCAREPSRCSPPRCVDRACVSHPQ